MNRLPAFAPLARFFEEVRFSLCKLNEIEFAAPWNPRRPTC